MIPARSQSRPGVRLSTSKPPRTETPSQLCHADSASSLIGPTRTSRAARPAVVSRAILIKGGTSLLGRSTTAAWGRVGVTSRFEFNGIFREMGAAESTDRCECQIDHDLAATIGLDRCCGQPFLSSGVAKPKAMPRNLHVVKGGTVVVADKTVDKATTLYPSGVRHTRRSTSSQTSFGPPRRSSVSSGSEAGNFYRFENGLPQNITGSANAENPSRPPDSFYQQVVDSESRSQKGAPPQISQNLSTVDFLTPSKEINITPPRNDSHTRYRASWYSFRCIALPAPRPFWFLSLTSQIAGRGLAWTPDTAAAFARSRLERLGGLPDAPASTAPSVGSNGSCLPLSRTSTDSLLPVPLQRLQLAAHTAAARCEDGCGSPRPSSWRASLSPLVVAGLRDRTVSPKYVSSRPAASAGLGPNGPPSARRAPTAAGFVRSAASPQAQYVSSRPSWQAFPAAAAQGKQNGRPA